MSLREVSNALKGWGNWLFDFPISGWVAVVVVIAIAVFVDILDDSRLPPLK